MRVHPPAAYRRLSAALVIMALTAASCGDDDATTTSPAEPTTTTAATTTTAPTTTTTRAIADAPAQEGSSPDGALTVVIPAGQTFDPVTVTATDVDPSFLDLDFVLSAYELGPAGAAFSEPVAITLDTGLPASEGALPLLLVIYGSGETWAVPETITTRALDGTVHLSFEIPHFTQVITVRAWDRPAEIRVAPPRIDRQVEDDFAAGVEIDYGDGTGTVDAEHLKPVSEGAVTLTGDGIEQFHCNEIGDGRYGFELSIPHLEIQPRRDRPWVEELMRAAGWYGVLLEMDRLTVKGQVDGSALCLTASRTPHRYAKDTPEEPDTTGDGADSEGPDAPVSFSPSIDLIEFGTSIIEVTAGQALEWFNGSLYPCGEVSEEGPLVICPDAVLDVPAGPMLVAVARMAEPIPLDDPEHAYVYAAVFDSNGDPADDWVFHPPYVWDYFQGADRWYQVSWDHRSGVWSVVVTQIDANQSASLPASAVRVLIDGDLIAWLIPMSEFSLADPGIRFTTFRHDGFWTRGARGGDVSGADPTEPLSPISSLGAGG